MQGGRPPSWRSRWRVQIDKVSKWLGARQDVKRLEEMRGNLAMVATVIATMTFQMGLNPPGGVVQSWGNAVVDCPGENEKFDTGCPGESVLAISYHIYYSNWLWFNNISFFSSLLLCLWLISGLPLTHRFPVWLMEAGMCVSLTTLSLTYLYGVDMILANSVWEEFKVIALYTRIILFVVVGIVMFFLVVRFLLLFVEILPDETSKKPPSDELD